MVIDGTFVVCALVFHDNLLEVEQKKKRQSYDLKSIAQQSRTAHSKKKVNRTEVQRCVTAGEEKKQNKQNGCPEMTNDLASKHTQ